MPPLLPILEKVAQTGRPLLIIAQDVDGEALATLNVNNRRGSLRCAVVRAARFGQDPLAFLDDIAVFTGGQVVTEQRGFKLENALLSDLGRADCVVISRDETRIIGGRGGADSIQERADALSREAEQMGPGTERDALMQRRAMLIGKTVTVYISGTSADDARTRSYAFKTAFSSLRAAENGWVAGGGAALLKAASILERITTGDAGVDAGIAAVATALEQPMRAIAQTARLGADDVIRAAKAASNSNYPGVHADERKLEDLAEAGILDATTVLQVGVKEALAAARDFLGTSAWSFTSETPPASPILDDDE